MNQKRADNPILNATKMTKGPKVTPWSELQERKAGILQKSGGDMGQEWNVLIRGHIMDDKINEVSLLAIRGIRAFDVVTAP